MVGYSQAQLLQLPQFNTLSLKNILILNQVHGVAGYRARDVHAAQLLPYSIDGDYIITTLPGVALAVETADCAPVMLVDTVQKIAAIAHAGWRGAVAGIAPKVVQEMVKMGSKLPNIEVFIGPAARGCCYEVSADFGVSLDTNSSRNSLEMDGNREISTYLFERNERVFFDNVAYIQEQLIEMGLKKEQINVENAHCTICNVQFCSYRRQGQLNLRQMSIVALK